MADKSPHEHLASIESALAALKSHIGPDPNSDADADDMEIKERVVGRGRKKRPAPFFKKKGEEESFEEDK